MNKKFPKRKSLGLGFWDEISKVTVKNHKKKFYNNDNKVDEVFIPNFNPENINLQKSPFRIAIISVLSIMVFFILFLKFFNLQIINGVEYRKLADGNRVQIRIIHAPRGVIYDRNNKILARNDPGFRLAKTFLTRDDALRLEVGGDPRAKELEIDHVRIYPFSEKTAHVLGYVSEISSNELKETRFSAYKLGDKIGRNGIEEAYEKYLKGIDGGEIIEVDAKGRKLRTLRTVEAVPGQNLVLNIDADLQTVVFNNLSEAIKKSGSCCAVAVVMEPQTGDILSMVSLPSFDPQNVESFLQGVNYPLLNRAISGKYPPGSTFKIASGLAGLSSGKITAQTKFNDTGVINLGPYTFSNWYFTQYGKMEGSVDFVKALERSNDTYFYRLAELVGDATLQDTAKKLGLDKKTGIDIPSEEDGLIPDKNWKQKTFNEVWFPGDTLHMVIGQGFVLSTPIQITNLLSFIVSDGIKVTPHIAKKFNFKTQKDTIFKSEYLSLIKKGLVKVTKEGGTAWPFFNFPIESGGKTGTAEYGSTNKTHAWYTGFAPSDDPKIVVTVLIEGGGEGSSVAAPVAKEIMRWFFSPDKSNLIKDTGNVASDSARTLGE